ncbi:hypothetical protein [Fontivita pretiosa]|uniref:hypothetical protein n=1 Tax=Fontivita pretiosa TaxID=2989684 RepID=UPI003D17DB81
MGSQDRPPRDIAESLTTVRLLQSLRSEVCPACGRTKTARQPLCDSCLRRVPSRIKAELQRRVSEGYDRAMLRALRHLKAPRFILPGDQILPLGRLPLNPQALRPQILRLSLESRVCPRCAGEKAQAEVFCHRCRALLRSNAALIKGGMLFGSQLREIEASIDPAMLTTEPLRYTQAVIDAIRLMKGRGFHHSPNQGGSS